MGRPELESLLKRPEILRQILGDYRGPFSIGVAKPADDGRSRVVLSVPDKVMQNQEKIVQFGDEIISVIIQDTLPRLKLF